MVVVFVDLDRGWCFMQNQCWFVGFVIVCGYKRRRRKKQRLKTEVVQEWKEVGEEVEKHER